MIPNQKKSKKKQKTQKNSKTTQKNFNSENGSRAWFLERKKRIWLWEPEVSVLTTEKSSLAVLVLIPGHRLEAMCRV